jgi:hypothetical protein
MKQTLHKRLLRLEQAVQIRRASERPVTTGHLEMIRGWLRAWGVEQDPDESLAMTLGRAMGISQPDLRDRLRRLACAQ